MRLLVCFKCFKQISVGLLRRGCLFVCLEVFGGFQGVVMGSQVFNWCEFARCCCVVAKGFWVVLRDSRLLRWVVAKVLL